MPLSERRGDLTPLLIPSLTDSGGPPAISAENLTKRFGDFMAVDHVSFHIERGGLRIHRL